MDLNIVLTWSFALLSGVFGGLAASQALTGRPTYPRISRRIDWSVRELKLLGLVWALNWLAMAVFGLVGALSIAAHQNSVFSPLLWLPLIMFGLIFQLLMEQHHNQRWPFKGRVSSN